jgi:DNA-directed RNA polymerase specialized sigma24 family protein
MTADPDVRLRKILEKLYRSPSDEDALGKLYKLMFVSVVAEAYYALDGDTTKAPDVAHEVLLTVARTPHPRLLKDSRAFLSYVSSMVLEVSRRHVRPRDRATEMEEGEREEVKKMLRETHETPDRASQKLRAEERDVLEKVVEGEKYRELAERYHVTEEAAEKLVAEARLYFRILTGRVPDNLPIPGDLE